MTQEEREVYNIARQAGCSAAEALHVLAMVRQNEGTAYIYKYVFSRLSKIWNPARCHLKAILVVDAARLAKRDRSC